MPEASEAVTEKSLAVQGLATVQGSAIEPVWLVTLAICSPAGKPEKMNWNPLKGSIVAQVPSEQKRLVQTDS